MKGAGLCCCSPGELKSFLRLTRRADLRRVERSDSVASLNSSGCSYPAPLRASIFFFRELSGQAKFQSVERSCSHTKNFFYLHPRIGLVNSTELEQVGSFHPHQASLQPSQPSCGSKVRVDHSPFVFRTALSASSIPQVSFTLRHWSLTLRLSSDIDACSRKVKHPTSTRLCSTSQRLCEGTFLVGGVILRALVESRLLSPLRLEFASDLAGGQENGIFDFVMPNTGS